MDFDEDRIYYSHQNLHQTTTGPNATSNEAALDEESRPVDTDALRRHFREFLRNYRQGPNRYIYRDRLLRMHRRHHSTLSDKEDDENNEAPSGGGGDWNPNKSYIHVDLAHVGEYDAALLEQLTCRPAEALPVFEVAAADALRTLSYRSRDAPNATAEEPQDGEPPQQSDNQKLFTGTSIQILLRGNLTPTPLRSIQSHHMNSLLKCPGIIVSAARSRPRAMCLRVRCGKCMDVRTVFGNSSVSGTNNGGSGIQMGSSSPFSGFSLPPRCLGPTPQGE
jgi:DNA replicative helicase MCM subunit Mcm2 (Cdc46/Mcm family)